LRWFRGFGKNVDILKAYGRKEIGLVYSNTITNGDILADLSRLGCPIITHVHELENFIHSCGKLNLDNVKRYSDLFIVASTAVKNNLVNNHQIDSEKVRVVHAFVPTDNYSVSKVNRSRKAVLEELGIPEDAFVVGGSGTTDWRKSPELFVQLAGYVQQTSPEQNIYFVWVGGALTWELEYDIKKLGLNNIRFVHHTRSTVDYFNAMDVFALVSRIDPYPLVCLEAASLGKPILCFAEAGGMPEFVESDSGFIVPYLNIEELTAKIMLLVNDRDLLQKLGHQAQVKVQQRHDIDVAGCELLKLIHDAMVMKLD
jgi:glycosyltransferase involved in cell wall biosynthesis